MSKLTIKIQAISEIAEIKTHFSIPGIFSVIELSYIIDTIKDAAFDAAAVKPEAEGKPEAEPAKATAEPAKDKAEPDAEVEQTDVESIPDIELLMGVSKVAEAIGSKGAKELVKKFAIGRGRPTVKNIPAARRAEFMEELKAAMVVEFEPPLTKNEGAVAPATEAEPEPTTASTDSKPTYRRRS